MPELFLRYGALMKGVGMQDKQASKKLFPEERRSKILEKLNVEPKVLVSNLTQEFDVSAFTIRADLDELEAEGKLRRCHGGAIPLSKPTDAIRYEQRLAQHSESKQRIGELASELVNDGDCIIVDTGTTTIELVRNLTELQGLTIITSDLEIASLAERALPNSQTFLLGGYIRPGHRYSNGITVLRALSELNADKAFISTTGFSPEGGFTTETFDQAEIKATYARRASTSYVLMDLSKTAVVALSSFLGVDDVDGIVTERPFPAEMADRIKKANPEIELIS